MKQTQLGRASQQAKAEQLEDFLGKELRVQGLEHWPADIETL